MTSIVLLYLWIICTLSAPPQRVVCFDICVQSAISELGKLLSRKAFDHSTYITSLPKCINEIGRNDDWSEINEPKKIDKTCPRSEWGQLSNNQAYPYFRKFFKCVNKMHQTKDNGKLWKQNPSIIAWCGIEAELKARTESTQSKYFNAPDWSRYDEDSQSVVECLQIKAVRQAFDVVVNELKRDKKNKKNKKNLNFADWKPIGNARPWKVTDLGCDLLSLWLVSQSDWSQDVHQYSSIDFDFTPKKAGSILTLNMQQSIPNTGKQSLLNFGVTKALVINSFFWNTEMITMFRMAKKYFITHGGTLPKLIIHMLVYNCRGEKVTPERWQGVDLFGDVNNLNNIPIIFKTILNPHFKNDPVGGKNRRFYIPDEIPKLRDQGIRTLLDLIKYYNTIMNPHGYQEHAIVRPGSKMLHTTGKFFDNHVKNLADFVHWTMGLKAATDQIIDTRHFLRNLNPATCNRFGCSSHSSGNGGRRNSVPASREYLDFYNINDNYLDRYACDGCKDRFSDDYDAMLLAPKLPGVKSPKVPVVKSMLVKKAEQPNIKNKFIIRKSQLTHGTEPNDCARNRLQSMYYYKVIKATFKKITDPPSGILYKVEVQNPFSARPDAGHMQSAQSGGRGIIANVMPQYPPTNEGNGDGDRKWRQFENNYYNAIKNGNNADKWELTVTQCGGTWARWKS